jgi:integrase
MAVETRGKPLPKGITYRQNEGRYMGRFMYHGQSFVAYGKTVKEAQKKLEELRYQVEHGIYFKEDSVTFSAWFEIWMRDYKEPSVKMGTVGTYRQIYNAYVSPVFGKKQLRDIRTDNIQRFYNWMAAEDYSNNTLQNCRAVLNGAFQQAVKNEIIQKNPVSNATLPRNNKKREISVMTLKEQKLFLQYARDTEFYPMYELALSTGMRSGELRGLHWNDIDFNKSLIHVTCTLTYQDGGYHIEPPKTSSSYRDIPMLDNVYELLKNRKKQQLQERMLMGELWKPLKGFENLVFTDMSGHPINRDRFKKSIDKIVKQINDDGIAFAHITPHTFRHSFATRSIENGIPPKVLQTILGHHDLATTMDTYAHVLPDTKVQEMQKLASIFA